MTLDFEIFPNNLGRAAWEVFDASTGECLASGGAASYSAAEAAARAEIAWRQAERAEPVHVSLGDGAWCLAMSGILAPLPLTPSATVADVKSYVQGRFPGRPVVVHLPALR